MEQNNIIDYHAGVYAMGDQLIGNQDYTSGAFGGSVASGTGRTSLGILGAAILGVMFFYVATRGRQF